MVVLESRARKQTQMSQKPFPSKDSCLSRSVLILPAPLPIILTLVCLCVSQGAVRLGGRVSQPPGNPAEPPPAPPPQDQSLLTNITFLKVLLWLVLLGLFVQLEFGLAYFVLSLFYWMYVGTRGPEEKTEGEKSAYSVFNPGCEAIQGTLTAEQLERELHLRPLQGRQDQPCCQLASQGPFTPGALTCGFD